MLDQPKYLNTWESETGLSGNDFERNLVTVRLTGNSFSRTKVAVTFKVSSEITLFQLSQCRVIGFYNLDNIIRQLYRKSIRMAVKLKRIKHGTKAFRSARRVDRRSRVLHKSR